MRFARLLALLTLSLPIVVVLGTGGAAGAGLTGLGFLLAWFCGSRLCWAR